MKKQYNVPKTDVQSVSFGKGVMLLGSPTGPEPGQDTQEAPARHFDPTGGLDTI